MNKQRIRGIIYENIILRNTWTNLIKFKDEYRFLHRNIINYFYYFFLIKVKGYEEVIFDKKIVNGMFKIFIKEKDLTVIKVIRKDNYSSFQFYRRLKNKQNYKDYCETLKYASNMDFIGEHICNISKIFRDGGYQSPFINGENLQVLKKQMIENKFYMNSHEYEEFLFAIEKLYSNIKSYNSKYGTVSGDWMLYNLVYDIESKKIVNVDLEGFYTWKGNETPKNIERIKKDLDYVRNLILNKTTSEFTR